MLYDVSHRAGHVTKVNMTDVALFRVDTSVYAIQERCPHAGVWIHFAVYNTVTSVQKR